MITSPEPLPNTEFSFMVADVVPDPEGKQFPIWGLARKHEDEGIWLMSDFGYWSWPLDLVGGYDEVRREIVESEIPFAEKKKQAVWRGAVATNGHREELIRSAERKPWADVKAIVWAGMSDISPEDTGKALSMPQHCQYQFVIHTEGTCRHQSRENEMLTESYRSQLLRPGQVSAELQLGRCDAQTNLAGATPCPPGTRGERSELCRGQGRLLGPGGEDYGTPRRS